MATCIQPTPNGPGASLPAGAARGAAGEGSVGTAADSQIRRCMQYVVYIEIKAVPIADNIGA